ncbi:Permease of the drug/metabolite transporter (DMT) superfamily [hydrothermal vent metagenome]|uniref:Permease of the drug/metabolite transporter (DMT) superfamily n=1 Tax=hydrothermal vent metagenome TaxID=652676 RepID=A0A3B0T297_9ZZZZ
MRVTDWLKLVLLSILWGGAFYFSEVALDHTGPLTIVMVRVTLAAVMLAVFCRLTGIGTTLTPALAGAFLIMGFINNVIPFSLITLGQTQITGSLAAILAATTPLFTVAVSHFWPEGEIATPLKIAGIIAGMGGVVVLVGVGALARLGDGMGGIFAVLAASLAYAVALLYARRFKGLHPIFLATGMLSAAALIMVPMAFAFETPFQPLPPASAFAAMAGLAVLASAVAYFLYFSVLQSAGPTNASLVTFMIPVSAIALGVTLRGEVLELRHIAGLALILVGLALVDGRLFRWLGAARR